MVIKTSDDIKNKVITFYKYGRGADVAATEVEFMDVLVLISEKHNRNVKTGEIKITPEHLIEIEVKVDKNDFLKDFEKDKHNYYCSCRSLENNNHIPNKFYYAVPFELKDFVTQYLISHSKEKCLNNYGVISFNECDSLYIERRAKFIMTKISDNLKKSLIRRVMTEYMHMKEIFSDITKEQKKHLRIYKSLYFYLMGSRVKFCRMCKLHEQYGHCHIMNRKIKETENKPCIRLFKDEIESIQNGNNESKEI
jgi:hypothetical protein